MSRKFYMYEKIECTAFEYITRKKESIRFLREDIAKEHKRHEKKIESLKADIVKREMEIKEAESSLIPKLPTTPKFV